MVRGGSSPARGEQVGPIQEQLRRGLDRDAVLAAGKARAVPSGGVEVGRVHSGFRDQRIERLQHAGVRELADPGQVHRDHVVVRHPCQAVADRLGAQPVDRQRARADRHAEHVLELPLQRFHRHEGRVGMGEDAQRRLQRDRRRAHRRHLDRRAGPVGAREEIVAQRGAGMDRRQCPADELARAARIVVPVVEQTLARVQRRRLAAAGARPSNQQPLPLHLLDAADRGRVRRARRRGECRRRHQLGVQMLADEEQRHVEIRDRADAAAARGPPPAPVPPSDRGTAA